LSGSFLLALEDLHVVLGLEMASLLRAGSAGVPIPPLLLLLLIDFLHLSILECEFESFDLRLLALLNVFRIIGKHLETVRNSKLPLHLDFHLFNLLLMRAHRPQSVQLHNFLRIVFLVLNQISLLKHFLYHAGVELSIGRVDGLAVSALLEEISVWFFEHL
jgi:hypothetical protein